MRVYQRKPGGVWWVDLGAGGTRTRRSTGTLDKAAAQEYAATLAAGLWRTARLGEAPRVTWDTAVLEWLQEHQHRRSIEQIKHILRWLTVHLRGMPLTEITDTVIRRVKAARQAVAVNRRALERAAAAGGTTPAAKPSSSATVNRHLAQLSTVLHYAHRRGWLPAVPPIAKAPEPAGKVFWLTRDQAADLLAELPQHLRMMATFALATGLRESNVRLLQWRQVDIDRKLAWFEASEMKAGRPHSVPLNAEALAVLAAQKGAHSRWVFPVPRWEAGQLLSDAPTGKISNHAWRKACTRAGLPTLRFHDLRHTWASWHVQAGTPLPVLQALGGWKSYSMVLRYAHLGQSHVAQWAGNLAHGGTNAAHESTTPGGLGTPAAPKAQPDQGVTVGWLMGLEPTTTGITIASRSAAPIQINELRALKRRKAG
jgi:integrase